MSTVVGSEHWIQVGTLAEVEQSGPKVVKGIAVFVHEGNVYAVENRCPHMGFPLHLGSVRDGILTCHWHHARFDVCSGGTLDPWADDVPAHDVRVEDGHVYVDLRPKRRKDAAWHLQRLREGLEQNLSLIIAKAVVALVSLGVPDAEIAKVGLDYGTTHRSQGWGSGLTILTANLNVLPKLDTYGHILDFHNKALEAVTQAQVDASAREVMLTSLIPALANPTRSEELQNWQAPIDLVTPLKEAFAELPGLVLGASDSWEGASTDGGAGVVASEAAAAHGAAALDEEAFIETVLGDDPDATVALITAALKDRGAPWRVARWWHLRPQSASCAFTRKTNSPTGSRSYTRLPTLTPSTCACDRAQIH